MTSLGTAIFATLGISCAAFCVWLAVRLVNRRERWAKRLAWTMAVFLTLYLLSCGPASWMYVHVVPEPLCPAYIRIMARFYFPIATLLQTSRFAVTAIHGYQCLWVTDDEMMERYLKDRDR